MTTLRVKPPPGECWTTPGRRAIFFRGYASRCSCGLAQNECGWLKRCSSVAYGLACPCSRFDALQAAGPRELRPATVIFLPERMPVRISVSGFLIHREQQGN